MVKDILQKKTDCLKIVLYGPESSGKTTLAKTLAAIYNTSWASEYARNYLQEKWDKKKEICNLNDLLLIARGQINLENKAIKNAKKFLQKGDKVKFTVRFKGREMQHVELGKNLMNRIIEDTKEIGKVEVSPKFEGRQMIMIIHPN